VIALDTNLLVYAHREDAVFHAAARDSLGGLIRVRARFAVPWPCAHEFVAVVTHPRLYNEPTPLEIALAFVGALHDAEHCEFIGEGPLHLDTLRALATTAKVRGGAIHDARIAALCMQHGVRELWSADRDFSRYPALRLRNPLLG
jgi:uncharacterized protein